MHKHHDKWLPRATSRSCSTSPWKQICHIAILGQVSTPRVKTKHCDFSCLLFILAHHIFNWVFVHLAKCGFVWTNIQGRRFFPAMTKPPPQSSCHSQSTFSSKKAFLASTKFRLHTTPQNFNRIIFIPRASLCENEKGSKRIYIWEKGLRYSLCTTF